MKSLYSFTSSLPDEIKQTGGHNGHGLKIKLKAGVLDLFFEDGALRYISNGKYEIVRMIYFAVRDSEWLNVDQTISDLKTEIRENSFSLAFSSHFESEKISFKAKFSIEGRADSSISVKMEGEALTTFKKNRIGFCVLHPIEECAGNNCKITHTDNLIEETLFPLLISPHQPFRDIKNMEWRAGKNKYLLSFSGDVFETEDQRNWTDASFKTYSTPLSQPYPVTVRKDEKIMQGIEFSSELSNVIISKKSDTLLLQLDNSIRSTLPQIGIGHSSTGVPLAPGEISALKPAGFDHYRIDLHLYDSHWREFADSASVDSVKLGLPVEFALFFDGDVVNQAVDFLKWVSISNPEIALISIFDKTVPVTSPQLADSVIPIFSDTFRGIVICCGTNANFAQLNRNRPGSGKNDCICYSIHPQEHASDNTTLVENLGAQSFTVRTAAEFANGKGIRVSPVNLKRRFNANVEKYETPGSADEFPQQADSRIMSLFGACWAAGSLKYLSEAGVKGITFFEAKGERGIIQGDMPSRWPESINTSAGMVFPVYHLFRYFLSNKSLKVIRSESSDPLKVDVFALSSGHYLKFIVINFTTERKEVIFTGISGEFTSKQLNTENFADAATDPDWVKNSPGTKIKIEGKILLEPFSLSFIDNLS